MILALILLLVGEPVLAEARVALVIGASRYGNVLVSAANDIRRASEALRRSGFFVSKLIDANTAALRRALDRSRTRASAADVALERVTTRGELTRQFVPPQALPSKPKPAAPAPRPKPSPPPPPAAPDPEISAWQLCTSNAEIAPCEAYLAVYPGGKWAEPARQRKAVLVAALVPVPAPPPVSDKALEKTNWLACRDGKILGACEYYLRSYPKGRWVRDAQSKAREVNAAIEKQRLVQKETADWDNCASNSLAGLCERFLATYPKSLHAEAARTRIVKLGANAK